MATSLSLSLSLSLPTARSKTDRHLLRSSGGAYHHRLVTVIESCKLAPGFSGVGILVLLAYTDRGYGDLLGS